MNFLTRLKTLFNGCFDNYIEAFLRGDDIPGDRRNKKIDTETAMKYTAVFACCRVLGETFASMPAMEYRRKSDNDREKTSETEAFDILHNVPNEEMAPFAFKEMAMLQINTGGNIVCERLKNRYGRTVGLYPYEWSKVDIRRDNNTKKLIYEIRDGLTKRELSKDEVFHIPGPSFDGITGFSPISYVANAIKLGLSYEAFGVNFYQNGAHSGGGFYLPAGKTLKKEAFDNLRRQLDEEYVGVAKTGKPMLLEDGLDYKPWTINPVDAQLIENKKFQIEDIARIYRVPLHLIQNLDRATNNNIEHQSLEFVMYTMLPWFKRWEENINAQLLTPLQRKAGFYIEFKVDGLLRGDAKSRADSYAVGRQWGWLSVNDIRRLENLNPIPNGDIYLQPLNMGEAGKIQVQDQIKALSEQIYKEITAERR